MRWGNARKSSNVEDRRGQIARRAPVKVGGGMLLIVVIAAVIFGQNPLELLGLLGGEPGTTAESSQQASPPQDDEGAEFVSVVLADMEDIWLQIFARSGATYIPARLVLFDGAVQSACGFNSAATGPFYCPPDRKVYIDLNFMAELRRLGASGDFALAYVIGHEVGHHVQNLMGTSDAVRRKQKDSGLYAANRMSVALELQADCYAGVWAFHSRERGNITYDSDDFAEGIRTAAVIGDDNLQRQSGNRVQPESFTHGSSEQRVSWLNRGLRSGNVAQCDTFD